MRRKYIEQGDTAEVVFKLIYPAFSRLNAFGFDEIDKYGRLVAYDDYRLVLMGKILSVVFT